MSERSDSTASFPTFSLGKLGIKKKKQFDPPHDFVTNKMEFFCEEARMKKQIKRKYRVANVIISITAFTFILLGKVSNILQIAVPLHLKNIKLIKLSLSLAEVSFSCIGGIFFMVIILIEVVAIRRFS